MKKRSRLAPYYSACSLSVMLIAHPALAQSQDTTSPPSPTTASAPVGSDIIVTAQRRSENVQKVPISITVISADQLARRGVQNIQDLSQASASLEFTAPAAAPGGGAFIRGIGTSVQGGGTAVGAVGVVLDGVVLGNANITNLFDVERVEVLKGPQGTLFGSSVSAGVLNITTKAPRLGETSGYVNSELALPFLGSEYTRMVARGALNLPVSQNSALRIAMQAYRDEGVTHDTYTGKSENFYGFAIRARYLAELSDRVTLNLIGDYDTSRDKNRTDLIYRAATPGTPLAQALAACGLTVSARNVDNCHGYPNFTNAQVGGVSGQLDVDLGGATLTSITSWRSRSYSAASDVIGIPPSIARQYMSRCVVVGGCAPIVSLITGSADDPQKDRNSLITEEVRLSSSGSRTLEWVTGLYYQRSIYHNIKPASLTLNFDGNPSDDLTLFNAPAIVSAHMSDYAAFGNVTYNLRTSTRIIGGLRFTHSDVEEAKSDLPNAGVSDYFSGRAKADVLTWRLGVQQDVSPNTMTYFTVATGYKAPMINDALTATNHTLTPIGAERPTSFELGIKQSLFDRRFNVNADLFYTRIENFQTQSCVSATTGLSCSNINVPRLISKGVEWDIFGHPWSSMTVNVSGIYNIARYPTGFLGADGSALGGYQLNYAPKFKMTVSLEQNFKINDQYGVVLGGDATIRSSQSMYLASNPIYTVAGQTLFNARIGLNSAAGWSLSMFGRNLGNKIYPTQIYPTNAFAPGGLWQVLDANSQRVIGLQFQMKF